MREKILELIADAGKPIGELESLEFLELLRDFEQLVGKVVSDDEIVHLNTAEDFCRVAGC